MLRALARQLATLGIRLGPREAAHVSNVVDDWLVLGAALERGAHDGGPAAAYSASELCGLIWRELLELLRALGFTVNEKPHKLIAPCIELPWLGVLLNTQVRTVFLPPAKVAKAVALLEGMKRKCAPGGSKVVTRSELDTFIRFLQYCAMVVYGGRAFLHRIRRLRYRTDGGAALAPNHHVYLNMQFRFDVDWWLENLLLYNGAARVPIVSDECDIELDATGVGGLGIFCSGGFLALSSAEAPLFWACGDCPDTEFANHWELYNFVVLHRVFGDYLRDRVVSVKCDNMAAVLGVRKFKCGSVDAIESARILRLLFGLCVQYNVRLCTQWIPGDTNVLADALSRCDQQGKWCVAARELGDYRAEQGYEGVSHLLMALMIRPAEL